MPLPQGEWNFEIQKISFVDSDEETVTFLESHKYVPYVTASPVDIQDGTGTAGQANVNVFAAEVGLNSCKIRASQQFTGTVHIKIVSIIS